MNVYKVKIQLVPQPKGCAEFSESLIAAPNGDKAVEFIKERNKSEGYERVLVSCEVVLSHVEIAGRV